MYRFHWFCVKVFAAGHPARSVQASLTPAGAAEPQTKIDRYLRSVPGSHQVSYNEVAFQGGTIAVADSGQRPASRSCPSQDLCLWNSDGDELKYFYCGTFELPGWTGEGSFYNNQSDNQASAFLDENFSPLVGVAAGAQGYQDWTPIWYIMVCDGPPGGDAATQSAERQ